MVLGASQSPKISPLFVHLFFREVKVVRVIFLSTYQPELVDFEEDFKLGSFNCEQFGLSR